MNELLSRRAFLLRSGAAACAGMMSACAGRDNAAPARPFPPGRFVDIHVHLGRTWNHSRELAAAQLLEWMDAGSIAQAAVLPLVSPEASSYPLPTEFVLAATRPHRDRLIPFAAIDPRTSYTGGAPALRGLLRDYADQGARGFGEHKPGLRIDDPRSMALYEACGELGLPVLFHLDRERNLDEPGLPGLERVLQAFPRTHFIGHGPGWWASISGTATAADLGGYPQGPVAPGGAIDRLMDVYPNLHGDLSAGSGAGALARDREFARGFLIRRAGRLLFGTDYLEPGQKVPQLELLDEFQLPPAVEAEICRENARRLLGLG
jgi:predicted TIM-barrel fold metal-dependent hydrolase